MEEKQEHHFHEGKMGSAIAVRINQKASSDRIVEIHKDGAVIINLRTGGNEAEVNKALLEFLSGVFEVQPKQLEVVAGNLRNEKLITILNLDSAVVQQKILKNISS
jgi:uncharacterized protein YggU (UPF0235/DUF167 family)